MTYASKPGPSLYFELHDVFILNLMTILWLKVRYQQKNENKRSKRTKSLAVEKSVRKQKLHTLLFFLLNFSLSKSFLTLSIQKKS